MMQPTNQSLNRRTFLKAAGAATTVLGLRGIQDQPLWAGEQPTGCPHAEALGWHLGCQAYTFNRFTFYEAIDKVASLGLRYIEAYPGQKLSAEQPDVKVGEGMSAAVRNQVRKKLEDSGVQLVCFGVVGLSKDEAASRRTFEFAKDMKIQTIVSEPAPDAMTQVADLCDEYGINVAIHNHPKPSHYWNPDTVLAACKNLSKRVGACADTGHWMRSKIDPMEAIKKLEGRIISFHFKDLNAHDESAHDVPWTTGKGDVKGWLKEIHRQGFKGVFSVEYEYHWENSVPEIAQCVTAFDKIAAGLGQ